MPKVFALMPFDEEFDPVYELLMRPVLETLGYEVTRADSLFDQQNILRDIVHGIESADLVIADLTHLNPNVFYELGVAHGLGVPTLLITQLIEEVPFDLRSYRVLEYSTHIARGEEFKRQLMEIANRHQRQEIEFGSPVSDFGSRLRSGGRELVAASSDQVTDERGFLDYLVEGEAAADRMNQSFYRIADATNALSTKIERHSEKIQELSATPSPASPKHAHVIAMAAAADLSEYAQTLEHELPELEESSEQMIDRFEWTVDWMRREDADQEQVTEFRDVMVELLRSGREALEMTGEYRDTVVGLRGVSRHINSASARVGEALGRVIATMENVEAFAVRVLAVLGDVPGDATPSAAQGV